jgi:hypothetical protein
MPTKKVVLLAGYLTLVFFTILLFFFTLTVKISQRMYLLSLIQILILTGLAYECFREGCDTLTGKKLLEVQFNLSDFWDFIAVIAGAFATYLLSVKFQLGPVVAAGLAGTIVALVKPRYGIPAYCGAFVGMACPRYLCSYSTSCLRVPPPERFSS